MRRKEVSRRLKSVAEVRTSGHVHRDRVGRGLDERPAAQQAGVFSQLYFDNMDGELATIESDLVTAEDAHVPNLVRIVQLRRASTELASGVYQKQTSARQILVGLYGSERDYELAAASGETPRVHQTLAEQVDQTVKLLRDPATAEPAVKIAGVTIDFGAVADDLEAGRERLEEGRRELQRMMKVADGTRVLVNAAIKEYDGVFPWVASGLESAFRLAGEHELADRIRTSRRRVSRRQPAGNEESKSGESTSGESEAEQSAAVEPGAVESGAIESSAVASAEATPSAGS